jgi:fucose 4-O-acetylase-like acetyltransferase
VCYNGNRWNYYFGEVTPNKCDAILSTFFVEYSLPVFFFISGYLYSYLLLYKNKYLNNLDFIRGKVKRLYIPCLLYGLVMILLFPQFFNFVELPIGILHTWFLFVLFVMFCLVMPLKNLIRKTTIKIDAIFILCLICLCGCILLIHNLYGLFSKLIYFIPFFVFGIFWSKYNFDFYLSKLKTLWMFIIVLFLINPGFDYFILHLSSCKFIVEIFRVCVSIIFIFNLISRLRIKSVSSKKYIDKLDQYSLNIYLIHPIIIWAFLCYMEGGTKFMIDHAYIAPFFLFLGVFIVSIASCFIIEKVKFIVHYLICSSN